MRKVSHKLSIVRQSQKVLEGSFHTVLAKHYASSICCDESVQTVLGVLSCHYYDCIVSHQAVNSHFCYFTLPVLGMVAESVEHGSHMRETVGSNQWSSQTNATTYQMYTCRFLTKCSTLLG